MEFASAMTVHALRRIAAMTARLALCAFVLIGLSQPSFAAGPEYCHRYATRAVQAQLSNIHYRCGYGGRRWSTDYDDHFGWCAQAPVRAVDREEGARRRMLRDCR
jgi:hypothetical protein